MIYQTDSPNSLIDFATSLITKDRTDLSKSLVFVPTRRAARLLEKKIAESFGGAAVLPRIVGLGEGDDELDEPEAITNIERRIILTDILLSVANRVGIQDSFQGVYGTAAEFIQLSDYLENEGIDAKTVNWADYVQDERKVRLLSALSGLDYGKPTAAEIRNAGIRSWQNKLENYGRVFCIGSTGSVRAVRELMEKISAHPGGVVILPGLCENLDDIGRTDPYWSIKQFARLHQGSGGQAMCNVSTFAKASADKQCTIDNPQTPIHFFNSCFSNKHNCTLSIVHCTLCEADSEAEEADAIALIAAAARREKKSVLIITPDTAGGQRITTALEKFGLTYDSSAGSPLSKSPIARVMSLVFEYMTRENQAVIMADLSHLTNNPFAVKNVKWTGNLFDFALGAVENLRPKNMENTELFFEKTAELSDIIVRLGGQAGHNLELSDIGFLLNEFISAESVRPPMTDNADVTILGTAEARMQTADVVIITGLSEGMFPKDGFSPNWIPRNLAAKLGLPSPDSKVSLMALDFMTLSCAPEVYWTRSKMSGGTVNLESRFLSRVKVMTNIPILDYRPQPPDLNPLDKTPPSYIYKGQYWATWLESLIHNPYLFYARHILNLRKNPDIWEAAGAKEFGNLVHDVIASGVKKEGEIIQKLEDGARQYYDSTHIMYRMWQNRFREMAPKIAELLSRDVPAKTEEKITANYQGRTFIAKADRIENGNTVIDIKTGKAPTKSQLGLGRDVNLTMPQLPLSAMILEENGAENVEMAFLQLAGKKVDFVQYDRENTQKSIAALKEKLNYLINITTFERPEYVEEKYRDFDDLARVED